MGKLLGRAFIKVDGQELLSKEGAKLELGGIQRNTIVGNRVHGFSEKVVPGAIECEVSVDAQTRLSTLAKAEAVTVLFEADTGQSYVLRNAWLKDPPVLTANEGGSVPLRFEGPPVEELTA